MEAVQTEEELQILGLSAAQGCKPASSSVILLLKATEPGSSEGLKAALYSFSVAVQFDRLD